MHCLIWVLPSRPALPAHLRILGDNRHRQTFPFILQQQCLNPHVTVTCVWTTGASALRRRRTSGPSCRSSYPRRTTRCGPVSISTQLITLNDLGWGPFLRVGMPSNSSPGAQLRITQGRGSTVASTPRKRQHRVATSRWRSTDIIMNLNVPLMPKGIPSVRLGSMCACSGLCATSRCFHARLARPHRLPSRWL